MDVTELAYLLRDFFAKRNTGDVKALSMFRSWIVDYIRQMCHVESKHIHQGRRATCPSLVCGGHLKEWDVTVKRGEHVEVAIEIRTHCRSGASSGHTFPKNRNNRMIEAAGAINDLRAAFATSGAPQPFVAYILILEFNIAHHCSEKITTTDLYKQSLSSMQEVGWYDSTVLIHVTDGGVIYSGPEAFDTFLSGMRRHLLTNM